MEILGLVDISTTWILVAGLLLLLYLYGRKRNRLFKDHGIPGMEPIVFIGNMHQAVKKGIDYDPSPYGDVYGSFIGGMPFLNVENLDMIREILIKQFPKFIDRPAIDLDDYPINHGMLFKKGEVWRRIRRLSSPTFSGSKLRLMCETIVSCCERLAENFQKAASDGDEILVKDYFGALTMDVIASTAFGIDTDAQSEMDGVLITQAKKVFGDSGGITGAQMLLPTIFPELMPLFKKLGFSFFPRKSVRYLGKVISHMIQQRKEESDKFKRIDFLQLLIDAEDDGSDETADSASSRVDSKHMTHDEVLGQALLFFVAGYETTSNTLHYAAYLLATNPEAQEKCYEEIQSVLGDNPPNYDNIKDLVYLDHVVTETLRMFPVVPSVNRTPVEDIKIGEYTVPKSVVINIPSIRIHRDQRYYTDPHAFRPERWERKSDIDPMSYLPFGHGPRQCIGMRLAQVEMRFALATVLKKIKFLPGKDTPMKLEAKDLEIKATILTKRPIKLRVEAR